MSRPERLDRAYISVSGPDTRPFLNNLLTQDLTPLASGASAPVLYSALLSPQGKLITDMMLWPQLNGVVIETAPGRAAELLRRLSMYKLRAEVEISDVTISTMTIWSPDEFPNAVRDPRLPELGWIKLAARDEEELASAYDARRIALGVPDLARDAAPEEVFALEALLDELNGVAFHKGCFVGQENVSRMKRRATTRKKFCPITFEGDPPPYGAVIQAGEAEVGTVRSGIPGCAMAFLRLDRALEAQAAGAPLTAAGRDIRLAPPPWLVLPKAPGADEN